MDSVRLTYEVGSAKRKLPLLFLVFGLWFVSYGADPLTGAQRDLQRSSSGSIPFDREETALYPVPQNAPPVSAGMNPVRSQPKPQPQSYGVNVLNFPEGQRPKVTDLSPWYGVYQASWNGIPVASAVIHGAAVAIEGKKFYQVQVQARSWRYLDLIWRMQDTIESLFDSVTLHPRRFIFRQRENRKRIDTIALFDPGSNKWVVHRQQGSKIKEYEFVSSETFDPISATYLARSLNFAVGDTLLMEVFGGKSRYQVFLDIAARERIALKSGDVDAYKIIPRVRNLNSSGYAERMREATVWLSADDQKTLLKLTSQVFIGTVSIELVEQVQ